MAHLETRNGWYRIVFHFEGERLSRSLKTRDSRSAKAGLAKLVDNLHRLDLGLIDLPTQGDPVAFLLNGQKTTKRKVKGNNLKSVTIKQAWKEFNETIPTGSLEESTLGGMNTHVEHLARLIGKGFKLTDIDKPTLQRYIEVRSQEVGRYGRKVSVQTIKKMGACRHNEPHD